MIETQISVPLDLSLYHLETGLAELVEYRQSRLADPESPANEEEIAALDAEIQRYEIATPVKTSGTVAVFRRWRSQRETAKTEVKRLQQIIGHIDCLESRLKDYCASILERMPEPKKGCRKLVGVDGSQIMLKVNGGLEPLEISDASMLPDELCTFTLRMSGSEWKIVKDALAAATAVEAAPQREPDNAAIRAALARPCPKCAGFGSDVVTNPSQMSVAALQDGASCEAVTCEACGGSGKNGVSGARLLERGSHVEVK